MSAEPEGLPELPKIKLRKRIDEVALVIDVLERLRRDGITAESSRRSANSISTLLDLPFDTVAQTLWQYVDKPFQPTMLAWQLAGRHWELHLGPLLPYSSPVRSEWLPMRIDNTTDTVWKESKPGQALSLFIAGGHPAGHYLLKKVPQSWLGFLAYRIGYTRRRLYDDNPKNLRGLWFFGYASPDSEGASLDFSEWALSPEMKAYNSIIVGLRTRFDHDKSECPFDYGHDCVDCPHTTQQCVASVNRA